MSACAAASRPRSAVAFASGAALAFFGTPMMVGAPVSNFISQSEQKRTDGRRGIALNI